LLNISFSAKNLSNMLQAVDLLNKAVARDPSFFQAYCLLASAHDSIYFLGNEHTPARLAAAEAAIESASRMRPDAGETHLARAENLYRGYRDYDGALAELDIAGRTLPNDSRIPELAGYIVRRRGKQEEGLRYLLRSLELDPRNFLTLQQTALSYQILRRYAEMARVLDSCNRPIPRLYACGNDMQSIMGGTYPGPGITLGPAVAFAYAAASDAARLRS